MPASRSSAAALVLQPGDRVGAVARPARRAGGPPSARPARRCAGRAAVDAAAVGEVQRLVDRVGQVVHGGRRCGRARWGARTPGSVTQAGTREDRAPHGRGRAARRRRRWPAPGRRCSSSHAAGGEAAVADVERARPPAQVAEDVRAGLAGEQLVELETGAFELGLVVRVDRDELAATARDRRTWRCGPARPGGCGGT